MAVDSLQSAQPADSVGRPLTEKELKKLETARLRYEKEQAKKQKREERAVRIKEKIKAQREKARLEAEKIREKEEQRQRRELARRFAKGKSTSADTLALHALDSPLRPDGTRLRWLPIRPCVPRILFRPGKRSPRIPYSRRPAIRWSGLSGRTTRSVLIVPTFKPCAIRWSPFRPTRPFICTSIRCCGASRIRLLRKSSTYLPRIRRSTRPFLRANR